MKKNYLIGKWKNSFLEKMEIKRWGKTAFTLVELFAVITILVILSTIGFISFKNFSVDSRETKRIVDISELFKKVELETWVIDLWEIVKDGNTTRTIVTKWEEVPVTQWVINFKVLWENRDNFLDPKTGEDYLIAYAVWVLSDDTPYRYIELAAISEKNWELKIVWSYIKHYSSDSENLFTSGTLYRCIWWENLPLNSMTANITWLAKDTDFQTTNPSWKCFYKCATWYYLDVWECKNMCLLWANPPEDFYFDTYNWRITWYKWPTWTWVVIPCEIGWVRVDSIGEDAFKGKTLISVIIPDSITSIWARAFQNNSLTNLVIPNSVTSLWERAFENNSLTSVTISNNITSIWWATFQNNQLTSLTIPNSVTSIWYDAFRGNKLTSLVIPNSVTSIWTYSFMDNQLTSVVISNTVTSLPNWAFINNKLTNVTIPNSVLSIWDYVFQRNSLTNIVIPNSVTSIWEWVFDDNQLTSATLWNSLETIWIGAFSNWEWASTFNSLTSVVIPNSVTSIWEQAFKNNKLTSVTISNSTTSIWIWAFFGQRDITSWKLYAPQAICNHINWNDERFDIKFSCVVQ